MDESAWQRARLIPTWGISGADEAERRATSALLAVVGAVREFSAALLRPLGAPVGMVETFIEVEFDWNGAKRRPDGLIRVRRGQREWVCLIEVKTGPGVLEREQIECYLDIARDNGFDAVVTISNQIGAQPGAHPVEVDKRKLKKVALHHLSWAEVLTAAVVERVHRKVSDPDQAWILGELIRYLESPNSGALAFTDLGPNWVTVREQVISGTARGSDRGVLDVARRWDQLLRLVALRLGRDLGADVQVLLSRKEQGDPAARGTAVVDELVTRGSMSGALKIAGTVGPMTLVADVRHGVLHLGTNLAAPTEGRQVTRVNWLTRQLPEDAPKELRIEAWGLHARRPVAALLTEAREDPTRLADEQGRELRMFRLAWATRLGAKRGVDRGSLVASVVAGIDAFYEQVVQNLRPYAVRAPKLPRETSLGDAGVDVTPSDDEIEETVAGPEGTFGGADRDVARDEHDDQVDEAAPDAMPSDEELEEWLELETAAQTEDTPVLVADEQVTADLGETVADPTPISDEPVGLPAPSPIGWAPPAQMTSVGVPLPPPSIPS